MGPMKKMYKKTKEDQKLEWSPAQNEKLRELNKISAARASFGFSNLALW